MAVTVNESLPVTHRCNLSAVLFQHADLGNFKKEISGTQQMWLIKSRSKNFHETGGARGTDENAGTCFCFSI